MSAYSTKAKSAAMTSPLKEEAVRSATSLARTPARDERRAKVVMDESLMMAVKRGRGCWE